MKRSFPIVLGLVILGLVGWLYLDRDREIQKSEKSCSDKINREILQKSLDLGTAFILNNQKPEGNFYYEYDWKNKKDSEGDNAVRQAGALWGLALIFQATDNKEVEQAFFKSLKFFDDHSKLDSQGNRYIVYPGDKEGKMGTVALVTLALIDYLRSPDKSATPEQINKFQTDLDQYLAYLVKARKDSGLWNSKYQNEDGKPFGFPSPYVDGEALLALIKAYNYMDKKDLRPLIVHSAKAGKMVNIDMALKRNGDSPITKGYYQWASMAFFEISQSDLPDKNRFGDEIIPLADWMIDVHRTLYRTRNTGYAYEGIVHAYQRSLKNGDKEHADKFKCVIDQGLEKLTTWQVGSPLANEYVLTFEGNDPRALGGVQNHRKEAPLRIDTAQHQMHAVILALKYVY